MLEEWTRQGGNYFEGTFLHKTLKSFVRKCSLQTIRFAQIGQCARRGKIGMAEIFAQMKNGRGGKMKRFFNTTLGLSMLPDGQAIIETLSQGDAGQWLREPFENAANPSHGNSLQAIYQLTGADVREPKGGRVYLERGDECLVAEISGIPRETREFTDEEIKAATFRFRKVTIL